MYSPEFTFRRMTVSELNRFGDVITRGINLSARVYVTPPTAGFKN